LKSKLPARKLERWFYTCAKSCEGKAKTFQDAWLGAADHYKTKLELSEHAHLQLYQFLHGFASDTEFYVRCRSTARVESIHNLSIKYVSKRVHYGYKRYGARKALAVFNWNENIVRDMKWKRRRTHLFRNTIVQKYLTRCRK
jgi:hypothetical protein